MAFKLRRKKSVNINRVVVKVVASVIALYVGGTIMVELGNVMNCTSSPFYDGLSLIGWTISDSVVPQTSGTCNASSQLAGDTATYNNLITSTGGSGILAVIGIIAIAAIVTEFVEVSM